MADEGDRPEKPRARSRPSTTSTGRARGLLDRIRKPDLSGLERTGCKRRRRRRRAAKPPKPRRPAERPLWRRVAQVGGIFALGWILLSFLAFAISAQIQKGKLADGVGKSLDGNPFMPSARRRSWCSAPTCARAPSPGPTRPSRRTASTRSTSGKAERRQLQARPLPLGHDHADPRRRRRRSASSRSPATRSPTSPGTGREEDQLRLRLRRREARGADGRGAARASTSTRSRSSTSTASASSSTRSAGSTSTCRPRSARASPAAPSTSTSTRARTTSTASRRSPSPAPARTPAARASSPGTDVERAQFQQLILDGIKGRLTDRITPADATSSRARSSAGTRRRRWSRAWAPDHAPARDRRRDRRRRRKPTCSSRRARRAAGNLVIPPTECERAVKKFLGSAPPHKPACSPPS